MNSEQFVNPGIQLLDVVALTKDIPEAGLETGMTGAVVEILSEGEAFEVEFVSESGETLYLGPIPAERLRLVWSNSEN